MLHEFTSRTHNIKWTARFMPTWNTTLKPITVHIILCGSRGHLQNAVAVEEKLILVFRSYSGRFN